MTSSVVIYLRCVLFEEIPRDVEVKGGNYKDVNGNMEISRVFRPNRRASLGIKRK